MPEHTHQTRTEVKLPTLTLENPQLWSCESPQLYSAEVVVTADGMVVDSLTEQFGVRSLEFSPEFGFKLNGKKMFLQGNANHHDLGALGAACYDRAIERISNPSVTTVSAVHIIRTVTVLPALQTVWGYWWWTN